MFMAQKDNTLIIAGITLIIGAALIGLGVFRWGWFAQEPVPPANQNQSPPANQNQNTATQKTVQLYYYNSKFDKTQGCDTNAVLPVARQIPVSQTPIQDTIRLLIKGELQTSEKSAGFTTEFPNPGFKLVGANLKSGQLTLEFTEVPGFTSGGSCRISLLASQITKTALQFPEVKTVKFLPEELFQP
jgi:spore germination protein GerM